jgi:hypothetical protein
MDQSQPRQIVPQDLNFKNPSKNRDGGMAQCEALSSSPSTVKKKRNSFKLQNEDQSQLLY